MVKIIVEKFAVFENKEVNKFSIVQENGLAFSCINYGATITNILVPDKDGKLVDVVLGFDNLDGYINAKNAYVGSICGRYANRIANGKFTLNDVEYTLAKNNGENSLHGGVKGFDKVFWDAIVLEDENAIQFLYVSEDMEEGFPGRLEVTVIYRLVENKISIEYTATTNEATPINLTSHCYFNLSGGLDATILKHDIKINATHFVEVDKTNIPTGNLLNIENTGMDFLEMKTIANCIEVLNGYDHCWVLNKTDEKLTHAASLLYKKNGIVMNVYTTEPGLQFYTGNFLDNTLRDTKQNIEYNKYAGLCLEAQNFPDCPNNKNFPNCILQVGETYTQKTIYSFNDII
jgi:aldose 1-epimerase